MILGIIPARGGSKRIPGKNIKSFLGKPIISYSILAAQESGVFDKIIVSTDSKEIATIARDYGAEVPFFRPPELSDDFTGTNKVIAHSVKHYQGQEIDVEYVCCIYATAPFIKADYIKAGFEIIKKKKQLFVFSATSFAFPIFRSFAINEKEEVQLFWPKNYESRSQDLPEAYHDAGQFYWGIPEGFVEDKCMFEKHSLALLLPRYLVQDIDTLDDWERAEMMYLAMQIKQKNGELDEE
jgi:pseudaminic acid cytidylyltransferase